MSLAATEAEEEEEELVEVVEVELFFGGEAFVDGEVFVLL